MRRSAQRQGLVFVVSLGLSGVGTAFAQVPRHPVGFPQCSGVWITTSERALPPKDMTFSSRETLDLVLRPRVRRDFRGEHVMHLQVFTPGGFLYQVITVPFVGAAPPDGLEGPARTASRAEAGPGEALAPRVVPGFPRPLDVQRLMPVRGGSTTRTEYELRARLPVAGTSITLSSLYGTWAVQTYLDGQPGPCGPATRFTIRE